MLRNILETRCGLQRILEDSVEPGLVSLLQAVPRTLDRCRSQSSVNAHQRKQTGSDFPIESVRACVRACVRAGVGGWVGGWVAGWVAGWVGGCGCVSLSLSLSFCGSPGACLAGRHRKRKNVNMFRLFLVYRERMLQAVFEVEYTLSIIGVLQPAAPFDF